MQFPVGRLLNCFLFFKFVCIDFLEPYKPRPETTVATARNLVHGALGLRRPSSKDDMEEHHKRHSAGSAGTKDDKKERHKKNEHHKRHSTKSAGN